LYHPYNIVFKGEPDVIKTIRRKRNKGVSLIMLALGLATLLGFAALAIDLGYSFNIQNQLQKATTSAALSGASAYNSNLTSTENITNIKNATEEAFKLFTDYEPGLSGAQLVGNIQVDTDVGAVRLQTKTEAPTYFIQIVGIRTLEVNARAAALNYDVPYIVMNDIPGPPAGKKKATVAFAESKKLTSAKPEGYNLKNGNRLQVVATLPIVNAPGPDISIIEMGDLDGYFVFVANDPTGPWYNITGTGVSLAGDAVTPGPGPQNMPAAYGLPTDIYRFFGSGAFDLEGTGIENARYVAIVDDNVPDGYAETDMATLIDESGFASLNELGTGADIDAVQIHQHSISISYDDLSKDEDGDGLIDAHNQLIGDYDKPGSKAKDKDNSSTVTNTATNTINTTT
jgi:hypothetical protein